MSRFSYPHNSVNSTLRDMCYASMESCFQGLSFIYLHLRPLNNLWGLYDPKTENMAGFLPVMEQFRHIELSAMPFIERSQWGLDFFFLHSWALSSFSGRYDQRTWKFYDEFHHFPVKYPPDIEHSRQWTLVCITVILTLSTPSNSGPFLSVTIIRPVYQSLVLKELILKGLWRPVTDKYLESVWPLGYANTISFSGQVTMLHHV